MAIDDAEVMDLSLASQRAVMALCRPPWLDTDDAGSFVSSVEHSSGFFSSTIGGPGADPGAVIAQAQRVRRDTGRPHFVWTPAADPLATAAWQHGLTPAYPLAVMTTVGPPRAPQVVPPTPSREIVRVADHATADLFRMVHESQFATASHPAAVVEHFAADRVLLDPTVHAVVVLDHGRPAAAGYLHMTDRACGIYWVATDAAFRHRGHGSTVTSALLAAVPARMPVVLQATRLGRPVYRRHGFADHGLVWCWAIDA